jgi:hypothetical protein
MQSKLSAIGRQALIALPALVLLAPIACDNNARLRYPNLGGGGQGGTAARDAGPRGDIGGGFTLPDPPAPSPSAQSADARACGLEKFTLDRLPASLMLVLDRSSSMGRMPAGGPAGATLWSETLAAVDDVLEATQSRIFWGLKLFPVPDGCQVAATPEVLTAPNNHAMVIARAGASSYNQSGNGGTPTPEAVARAVDFLRTQQDKGPKHIVLATDGEPTCPDSGAARPLAVQAVRDAAAAGFKTYVIGIAIEPEGVQTLNQMAMAGGAPRNDPMFQFYPVGNRADLSAALDSITGQVASCVFNLSKPPPAPDSVKVTVDGERAPESMTDGWSYTSPEHTAIQLNGSWCERVKTRQQAQVDIVLGCPGIVVP